MNEIARIKILTKGITMGKRLVRFEGVNPFTRGDGAESSGTRLWISNLPFSYSNEAVARNLAAAGFNLRSKITFEKARGPDRMLTDWRTGRRSVWIDLPKQEVSRHCKMGDFSAFLFHEEMKDSMTCRRCLQKGHMARDCPNEEICLDCRKPGHRRGHPECEISQDESIWGPPRGSVAYTDNATDMYVWGNPVSNVLIEKVADEEVNDDDRSEKNVEVSTVVNSNVSNESEGDEEDAEVNERKRKDCDEDVPTGKENTSDLQTKGVDAAEEAGIGQVITDEEKSVAAANTADENEIKSLSSCENVPNGNLRDVSDAEDAAHNDANKTISFSFSFSFSLFA